MIAALYVQTGGAYFGLEGVDPWDEVRDARLYAGPFPVVAHPPCSRWCQLAPLNEHRYGESHGWRVGDDGGCFVAALAAVRQWGGVLEHPAYSIAWRAFDLPVPPAGGGWQRAFCGGWVCHVEQRQYGHPARKATWLYAFGCELPSLEWGPGPEPESQVSQLSNRKNDAGEWGRAGSGWKPGLTKAAASRTPEAFKAVLLEMARSVYRVRAEAAE